ncbi:MAG: hypothetical protein RL679_676 [Bacteroidota bacterium]|jgi:hypothetical protein
MLHSIQKIKYVYKTGQSPVLVECNNLKDYVCKHNGGQLPAYSLFAEWMCHSLLEDLGVAVAPKELIKVKDEHVLGTIECQVPFFNKYPCFGTLFLENTLEWSQFPLDDYKSLKNKVDIIIIAFCDIWFGNDDRYWDNFNLLFHPSTYGWEITPIDHEQCFNGLSFNLERPLYEISYEVSLIDTPEFRKLVKPMLKKMKDADDFAESLYIRILKLVKKYDEHVLEIPKERNIPNDYIIALKSNLFQKDWLIETKTTFLTFIKSSLKIK